MIFKAPWAVGTAIKVIIPWNQLVYQLYSIIPKIKTMWNSINMSPLCPAKPNFTINDYQQPCCFSPFRGIHEGLRPPRRSGLKNSKGEWLESEAFRCRILCGSSPFFTSILHQNHIWQKKWELPPFTSTRNGWCSWWKKNIHPNGTQSEGILLIELLHVSWPFKMKTNLPVPVKRMYFKKKSSNISTAIAWELSILFSIGNHSIPINY